MYYINPIIFVETKQKAMPTKYVVNDRVINVTVYKNSKKETMTSTRRGIVIEVSEKGEHVTGTSNATEPRYRIKWDVGPRTWFRQSALQPE